MRTCVVPFCCNTSKKSKEDVQFYKITPLRHDSWMTALKRNHQDSFHKDDCVCSDHFLPEDFIFVGTKQTLRVGAIPSVKLRPSARTIFLYTDKSSVKLAHIPEDFPILDSSTQSLEQQGCHEIEQIFLISESESNSYREAKSDCDIQHVSGVNHHTLMTDNDKLTASPKERRKLIHLDHNYNLSPSKLTFLQQSEQSVLKTCNTLGKEKTRVCRLQKKAKHLGDVVKELKKQHLISGTACLVLEKTYSGIPLEVMKTMLCQLRKGYTTKAYPEVMKNFAITLHFYSPKAYDYTRKVFNLALPSSPTIRCWIECMPGFYQQALNPQVAENEKNGCHTSCSLMLDDMAIREQINFKSDKVWGYVDCGSEIDEELTTANEV